MAPQFAPNKASKSRGPYVHWGTCALALEDLDCSWDWGFRSKDLRVHHKKILSVQWCHSSWRPGFCFQKSQSSSAEVNSDLDYTDPEINIRLGIMLQQSPKWECICDSGYWGPRLNCCSMGTWDFNSSDTRNHWD